MIVKNKIKKIALTAGMLAGICPFNSVFSMDGEPLCDPSSLGGEVRVETGWWRPPLERTVPAPSYTNAVSYGKNPDANYICVTLEDVLSANKGQAMDQGQTIKNLAGCFPLEAVHEKCLADYAKLASKLRPGEENVFVIDCSSSGAYKGTCMDKLPDYVTHVIVEGLHDGAYFPTEGKLRILDLSLSFDVRTLRPGTKLCPGWVREIYLPRSLRTVPKGLLDMDNQTLIAPQAIIDELIRNKINHWLSAGAGFASAVKLISYEDIAMEQLLLASQSICEQLRQQLSETQQRLSETQQQLLKTQQQLSETEHVVLSLKDTLRVANDL